MTSYPPIFLRYIKSHKMEVALFAFLMTFLAVWMYRSYKLNRRHHFERVVGRRKKEREREEMRTLEEYVNA